MTHAQSIPHRASTEFADLVAGALMTADAGETAALAKSLAAALDQRMTDLRTAQLVVETLINIARTVEYDRQVKHACLERFLGQLAETVAMSALTDYERRESSLALLERGLREIVTAGCNPIDIPRFDEVFQSLTGQPPQ